MNRKTMPLENENVKVKQTCIATHVPTGDVRSVDPISHAPTFLVRRTELLWAHSAVEQKPIGKTAEDIVLEPEGVGGVGNRGQNVVLMNELTGNGRKLVSLLIFLNYLIF